jgi:hypothetical protein
VVLARPAACSPARSSRPICVVPIPFAALRSVGSADLAAGSGGRSHSGPQADRENQEFRV